MMKKMREFFEIVFHVIGVGDRGHFLLFEINPGKSEIEMKTFIFVN